MAVKRTLLGALSGTAIAWATVWAIPGDQGMLAFWLAFSSTLLGAGLGHKRREIVKELIGLRFVGGPLDGATQSVNEEWPPADIIRIDDHPEGVYQKVLQSELPPGLPHVMRGAQYEWR